MFTDKHPVIVKNLCKTYGRFEAVKNLNFHVDVRDCFGLLGGKSIFNFFAIHLILFK